MDDDLTVAAFDPEQSPLETIKTQTLPLRPEAGDAIVVRRRPPQRQPRRHHEDRAQDLACVVEGDGRSIPGHAGKRRIGRDAERKLGHSDLKPFRRPGFGGGGPEADRQPRLAIAGSRRLPSGDLRDAAIT